MTVCRTRQSRPRRSGIEPESEREQPGEDRRDPIDLHDTDPADVMDEAVDLRLDPCGQRSQNPNLFDVPTNLYIDVH